MTGSLRGEATLSDPFDILGVQPSMALDPGELERRYLDRVGEKWRYLESPDRDRVQTELDDVFLMPEAVQSPPSEMVADVAPGPELDEQVRFIERVLPPLGRRRAERR